MADAPAAAAAAAAAEDEGEEEVGKARAGEEVQRGDRWGQREDAITSPTLGERQDKREARKDV